MRDVTKDAVVWKLENVVCLEVLNTLQLNLMKIVLPEHEPKKDSFIVILHLLQMDALYCLLEKEAIQWI